MGLGAAPDTPSLGSNSQFNRDLANKAFLPNADDFIKTLVFNIWGGNRATISDKILVRELHPNYSVAPAKRVD